MNAREAVVGFTIDVSNNPAVRDAVAKTHRGLTTGNTRRLSQRDRDRSDAARDKFEWVLPDEQQRWIRWVPSSPLELDGLPGPHGYKHLERIPSATGRPDRPEASRP